MRLSEALKQGIKLRPRVGPLGERFSYVETTEGRELRSDIWGAAVEAVMPTVADFNWNRLDVFAFYRTNDAFRAIQKHYFADYFDPVIMPARCPGANTKAVHVGGRVIRRHGKPDQLKTYDDFAHVDQRSVTSECVKVQHLAGLIDHMYHKHRILAEDIAQFVEDYENAKDMGVKQQSVVNQNFNHYQLTGG